MVAVPGVIPVTVPPVTEAFVLLLLHTPPGAISVNVIEDPSHTLPGPLMVPASGNGLTVIILVATAVPHELVTE